MTLTKPLNGKSIWVYLLLTFLISAVFYFLIIYNGKLSAASGRYATGIMWSPAFAAFASCLILKIDIRSLGWEWGETKYQVQSYLIPFLYALVTYLFIWCTGLGGFYNPGFVQDTMLSLGLGILAPWMTIGIYFLLTAGIGIFKSMANALGEEIGWRGFLVPRLYNRYGYTKTSIISGLIWSLWHYPILLFADYHHSTTPSWYALGCFTLMTVCASFLYTWLRIRSGSLWTAVLLHASHNLFIQSFFSPLTVDYSHTAYYIDEFGIVLPVITLIIAVICWKKRKMLAPLVNEGIPVAQV
ncbi:CPBP family intramembrane metalloprotease [Pedobacter sp. PAMC26386]|nr:CPBP family intramembrane metalloprotease [Pedobacter sp. PAMC26386]